MIHAVGCLNCGATPTIRAHLIPQAFVKEVRGSDTDHAIVRGKRLQFRASKNGLLDDRLLCQRCDGRLGEHENYAFRLLASLRNETTGRHSYLFEKAPVDGDRLLRFIAGIAWKYASTSETLGRISVGPYRDVLRDVALRESAIPSSVDAFLGRIHTGDSNVYVYRAPLLDKQFGLNFVRFSVGGFALLLKLDKRPNPQNLPRSNWLRGSTEISFPVLPMTSFEEGTFVLTARRQNAKLDSFLRRVERP